MNNLIHHKLYYKIAGEKLIDARDSENAVRNLLDEANRIPWIKQEEIDKYYIECAEAAITSVVFSALTIEAFINYYGISRLSQSEFDRLFSKNISLYNKWIEIPKLVTGVSIDVRGEAATLLQRLIRSRNLLVHYKSQGSTAQQFYKYTKAFDYKNASAHLPWLAEAEVGINVVIKLIEEIHKIDNSISPQDINWGEDIEELFQIFEE